MALSPGLTKTNRDAHEPRAGPKYAAEIETLIEDPSFIQKQLFEHENLFFRKILRKKGLQGARATHRVSSLR
jgi:hypothetical protein